jgi:hypothetical protein
MIHDAETISVADCDSSNPFYVLGERVSGLAPVNVADP